MDTTLKSSALKPKERGVLVKLLSVCFKDLGSTLDSGWVCLGVREISDVEPTRTSQGEEIASKAPEGTDLGNIILRGQGCFTDPSPCEDSSVGALMWTQSFVTARDGSGQVWTSVKLESRGSS